ncbi:expressed unknown protein [Seminavis robusta]|uniref:Uncharacterized protein n=1 Tax=Seminavis robusta TaxID=568900 RepID=A0A9N8HVU1_9STRA|nr:expressed unknown protein [Seminavis robusta]|eukprot:Sro1548_g281610.1 n/a (125) ;mRNA; r:24032-24406
MHRGCSCKASSSASVALEEDVVRRSRRERPGWPGNPSRDRPRRLSFYGLSRNDHHVSNAMATENVNIPGGASATTQGGEAVAGMSRFGSTRRAEPRHAHRRRRKLQPRTASEEPNRRMIPSHYN